MPSSLQLTYPARLSAFLHVARIQAAPSSPRATVALTPDAIQARFPPGLCSPSGFGPGVFIDPK